MKKVLLISLIILSSCFFTGCTTVTKHMVQNYSEDDIVCIDGIEYFVFGIGYQGYMAPHLTTDKFNNAKVIKCEAKNEN